MEHVSVTFKGCNAGWIFFDVSVGSNSISFRATEVFDPFPDLIAWLEAIAGEAANCSFTMDEEGPEMAFNAFRSAGGTLRLLIECSNDKYRRIEAEVDPKQCVAAFYKSLRRYAASDDYAPSEWEYESLGERIQKITGRTEEDLIAEFNEMSAEELKELFFNAAPRYQVQFLDSKTPAERIRRFYQYTLHPKDVDNPEMVLELPEFYEFSDDFDYLPSYQRQEFIGQCLADRVSNCNGCKLRELASQKLEEWLS